MAETRGSWLLRAWQVPVLFCWRGLFLLGPLASGSFSHLMASNMSLGISGLEGLLSIRAGELGL